MVPSEAPWPAEAWGLKLGSRVHSIRSQEHFVKDQPERRAELDAMGFVWDELERRKEKGRRHLAAELAAAVPKEPRAAVSEEGRRLLGGLVETGEAVLCEAAVSALAAAAAIPQLAGLQATAVRRDAETISRGAADDKAKPQAVPSVAALLLA